MAGTVPRFVICTLKTISSANFAVGGPVSRDFKAERAAGWAGGAVAAGGDCKFGAGFGVDAGDGGLIVGGNVGGVTICGGGAGEIVTTFVVPQLSAVSPSAAANEAHSRMDPG